MSLPLRYSMLELQTAEGHRLSLPLAGPMTRFVAWAIDSAGSMAIISLLGIVLQVFAVVSEDLFTASNILLAFTVNLTYSMLFEWGWRGQTPGKRILGIRVLDAQGLRLTPGQVVLRNLLRLVDALPLLYAVGGAAMTLSPMRQRLGDLVSNTIVVRQRVSTTPDYAVLMTGKYNSFRAYPHLEARLRQRLSLEGVGLIAQALMRRDELDPTARVALYGDLVQWLQSVVAFPDSATRGLTDEQYLRNALDSLYRREQNTRAAAAERT